jgi:hypothetical protein
MTTTAKVRAEVDRLGSALGHAVLIEDAQHRPLWWSRQGEVDATRMRSILERECGPAAAAVVARLGLARAIGPVRVAAVPEAEMLSRWCVPLRAGRDLLGYLWVLDADEAVTDAGGDIAHAAEQLHVHRTTLYYRIERIEAVTGVNLKTGADRGDLHMALRLAAYRLADD